MVERFIKDKSGQIEYSDVFETSTWENQPKKVSENFVYRWNSRRRRRTSQIVYASSTKINIFTRSRHFLNEWVSLIGLQIQVERWPGRRFCPISHKDPRTHHWEGNILAHFNQLLFRPNDTETDRKPANPFVRRVHIRLKRKSLQKL